MKVLTILISLLLSLSANAQRQEVYVEYKDVTRKPVELRSYDFELIEKVLQKKERDYKENVEREEKEKYLAFVDKMATSALQEDEKCQKINRMAALAKLNSINDGEYFCIQIRQAKDMIISLANLPKNKYYFSRIPDNPKHIIVKIENNKITMIRDTDKESLHFDPKKETIEEFLKRRENAIMITTTTYAGKDFISTKIENGKVKIIDKKTFEEIEYVFLDEIFKSLEQNEDSSPQFSAATQTGKKMEYNNSTTAPSEISKCGSYLYYKKLLAKSSNDMCLFGRKEYDLSNVTTKLPENATVAIIEEGKGSDIFYKVCYNGTIGYISKYLLGIY